MELNYEQKQRKGELEILLAHTEDFIRGETRLGTQGVDRIKAEIAQIIDKYGLAYVSEALLEIARPARQTFVDFQDEIHFAITSEISRVDPSWKHLLMSKKISDMTGYEYKTYLELIGQIGE